MAWDPKAPGATSQPDNIYSPYIPPNPVGTLGNDTDWRDITSVSEVTTGSVHVRATDLFLFFRLDKITITSGGKICNDTAEGLNGKSFPQDTLLGVTQNSYGQVGRLWAGFGNILFSSGSPTDKYSLLVAVPRDGAFPTTWPGTPVT